jgi:hypothetical protein
MLGSPELLACGKQDYFYFVDLDGSFWLPDVLCGAVIGFRLSPVGAS